MIELLKGDFLRKIMNEYKPDSTIFNKDTDEMTRLKAICFDSETLSQAESIILLLYCELASLRKVGEVLGVSTTTAYFELQRIKEKVLKKYYDNTEFTVDNNDSGLCN